MRNDYTMQQIKKHKNKNNYLLVNNNIWVRDFTKPNVYPLDINNLISDNDYNLLLDNEIENSKLNLPEIETEHKIYRKCIIVSDGYDFANKLHVLESIPKDVGIISVNGSLAKWNLKRIINYYFVNNPFNECMNFFPKKNKYFPACIASIRTNSNFLRSYKGLRYIYYPTCDSSYSGIQSDRTWNLDEYRNPICGAISLCNKFDVSKIMLFCCDDSFVNYRPSSVQLKNGLFTYEQHIISKDIIDGCLYWLSNKPDNDVEIAHHSSIEYNNANYIEIDSINKFFES